MKSARHTPAQPLRRAQPVHALAAPQHGPVGQAMLPGNAGKAGRFTRPVGANQGHALAHLHVKTDAFDGLHPAEVLDQTTHLQRHGRRHFCKKPNKPDGDTTMISITSSPRAPRQ